MPVEVTDVIDGANATSSSAGRAVSQEEQRCLLARKPETLVIWAIWGVGATRQLRPVKVKGQVQ